MVLSDLHLGKTKMFIGGFSVVRAAAFWSLNGQMPMSKTPKCRSRFSAVTSRILISSIQTTMYQFLGGYMLIVCTVSLQKKSQLWPAIGLTRSHRFLQFLAHVISRDSKIGCRYNFLKYLAFTYFIMLWSEMISMSRCPCTSLLLRHRQRCVKMFFSVDDKVLIKSLYQFSGKLVQTFN